MSATIRLQRIIAANPEKVYRAFVESDAMAKWLPMNGFTCTVHEMEVKVGGTYRMSFENLLTGQSHAFSGEYLELVEGEKIQWTDRFDDPNLPGKMVTTVTFRAVSKGTELTVIQEGIPNAVLSESLHS